MDPEDVRALVDASMARMGSVVDRFGGSVDKVIGDELMAVFGARVAHEDDSERAVRAALDMHRLAAEHAEEFGALRLRIGVNTGEVLFAPVGPGGARSFTVMGDAVNTASRLCQAAGAGQTLVGEETYRASRRSVTYSAVEPLRVKGKEVPLAAWQAIGAAAAPVERAVSAVPMVGRGHELRTLENIWEQVTAERRPHLVTVLGPPGIGKTRLVGEFIARAESGGGRALRGRALPYGETAGYGAFAQQVKEAAGIFETDSAPEAGAKLVRRTAALLPPEEAESVAARLAVLVGLGAEAGGSDKGPLFSSARRFVEGAASERPTVLVFEDIHWADPSLFELVEFLASRCREVPALLLGSARPELLERRPVWGGGLPSSTVLELHPLTASDSRDLVGSLLSTVAGPVTERVVETAGGNPLFLEELAASVAEGATEMSAPLPTSVRAIIAARLDALPAAEREVVLDASVVGKVFWQGALERLGTDGHLHGVLDSLEARDLIRVEPRSQLLGDREFSFKHMLIREVAYATLPHAARRTRHAIVARFVEEAAGDRLGESASLLAHHWREAGDHGQALRFLLLAAEHASRAWAKSEAVTLFTQALELIPGEDRARRASVLLRRATTLLENGEFPAAAAELDSILPDLEGRDRAEALLGRGRTTYWLADPEGAASFSSEATELAEALGDEHIRARALAAASLGAALDGRTGEAITLGEAALATWRPESHRAELGVHAGFLGAYHYWVGGYERAVECSQRAYDLGIETHSVEAMLVGGGDLGLALAGLGRHEEALQVLERVVAQGKEVELRPAFTSRATNMWAGTLREVFDLERARELNQAGIELARRTAFVYGDFQGRIDLLVADLAEGDVSSAEKAWPALWEAALAAKGLHRWLMAGRLVTARAEIALALGRPEEAADAAREAVAFAERYGRLKYEVASRLALGSALLELRQAANAVTELRRAMAGAERLGHPPSRWRTAFALARALVAVGDDAAAQAASVTAGTTVKGFAQRLSQDRKDRFLAAPSVVEILAAAP
jgi:class 3 adenylate cyclase